MPCDSSRASASYSVPGASRTPAKDSTSLVSAYPCLGPSARLDKINVAGPAYRPNPASAGPSGGSLASRFVMRPTIHRDPIYRKPIQSPDGTRHRLSFRAPRLSATPSTLSRGLSATPSTWVAACHLRHRHGLL